MSRSKHFRAGAPTYVVLEFQAARVEIGLRAYPHVITDFTSAVIAALDHRLGADEYSITELHRFKVFEDDTGTNAQAVTGSLAHRSNENSPHQVFKPALALAVPRIEHMQLLRRMLLTE